MLNLVSRAINYLIAILLMGGAFTVSAAEPAGAPCYPGILCAAEKLGPQTIALTEPTKWLFSSLEIADGTIIITNGYPLSIIVEKDLLVLGSATIRAFARDAVPITEIVEAAHGSNGNSFDRGPNTGGPCPSCRGLDGGNGAPGAPGANGSNGQDAGLISIEIRGSASGSLVVANVGMRGGDGGVGGNGGAGGNGQQGGLAVGAGGPFGIKLGCASGPGAGGNGGSGGSGGAGGRGGNGGNGGDVALLVRGASKVFREEIDRTGGQAGQVGKPGIGGAGGLPGYGGRGSAGCEGREIERQGKPGAPGNPGQAGVKGQPGAPGRRI